MSAAARVLERARAAGVQLQARGDRLAYDAPSNVSPDLLVQLRERKAELLELLRHERRELVDPATDPTARTRCLGSLIVTLSPFRVPHHWPAARWPQSVADAEAFCRDWVQEAFVLGWPAWELFGCHRRAPWGRIQGMGLVLLLQGDEIAAMTTTEAVIRTPTGVHQIYRRKPADPLYPAERCLVWELDAADGGLGRGSVTPTTTSPMVENRMKAEQLRERAPGILAEQDPCLSWREPELVRQPIARLYSPQQDGGQ